MRSTQHPTEPPPEGPSWSAGELISFGGLTDKGTGYMGYSERVGPSVLVLHDAYGLLPSVRALTDRFVNEGFTTLAVDLYGGRYAEDAATAHRLAAGLDTADTMKRVVAAAEHLSNNWHPRLGVVGFSIGASLATMLAHEVAIDATVVYYGGGARSRAVVGRASSARALRARGRLRAGHVSADGNERDGGCRGVRLRRGARLCQRGSHQFRTGRGGACPRANA